MKTPHRLAPVLLALLVAAAGAGAGAGAVSADEVLGSGTVLPAFELKIARFGHFVFTFEGGALATVGGDRGSELVAYDADGKQLWRFGPGEFPYPPAPVPGGGCVVTWFSPTRVWSATRLDASGKKVAEFAGLEPMSASALGADGTTYVIRAGDLLSLTPEMSTRWSVKVGERVDLRDGPHVTPGGPIIAPGRTHAVGVDPAGKIAFKRLIKKGRVSMRSESSVGSVIVSRDPGPEALAAALVEVLSPAGKKIAGSKLKYVKDVELVPEVGLLVVGAAKTEAEPTAVVYATKPAGKGGLGRVLWASAKTLGPAKVYDAAVDGGGTVFLSAESGPAGAPEVVAMNGLEGGVRWRAPAPRPYVFVGAEGMVWASPLGAYKSLSRITADEVGSPTVVVEDLSPTEAIAGPGGRIALREGATVRVFRP